MKRRRLTITLKENVLKMLDNYIDGSKIRNRSHAIEYILQNQLFSKDVKVLILTGGKTIRLEALKQKTPKALAPIHKKALLEYTLERLAKAGLKNIIISTGKSAEGIKRYFKDGARFGVHLTYLADKQEKAGNVRPLIEARKYLDKSTFIVIHGDVLADIDYLEILNYHKQNKGFATMALTSIASPAKWGVAYLQGNKILSFKEKPRQKVSSHLINAGIYVFNQRIFDYLKPEYKNLSREVMPLIVREGNLFGYSFKGKWYDVASEESYKRAVKGWEV
ncbi:MAG: NTP transferase domain-containing protein [Candidatus Moranbacteria bacterium]|nr:NTP transferase domain-containing protein [Candidatus Moranbacteria bacterium]